MNASSDRTALIIGASRGLGYGMAEEFLKLGWRVIATKRGGAETKLDDLAAGAAGRLDVETLDIDLADQIGSLRAKLASQKFDLLFVNAGISNDGWITMGEVATDEFLQIMMTNVLGPMRVIEAFHDLTHPAGTIGVMSSGFGSVANNENGGYEAYRASKAALNISMRSVYARYRGTGRTWLIMNPGWVRTDMGGPNATLSVDECIPDLVATIEAQAGKANLQFLDYLGRTVAW